jgi:hypothetical protein
MTAPPTQNRERFLLWLPVTATRSQRISWHRERCSSGKPCAAPGGHEAPTNVVPQPGDPRAAGSALAGCGGRALPLRSGASGMRNVARHAARFGGWGGVPRSAGRHLRDVRPRVLRSAQHVRPATHRRARIVVLLGSSPVDDPAHRRPWDGDAVGVRQAPGHDGTFATVSAQRHTSLVIACAAGAPRVDPALCAACGTRIGLHHV